MQLDQTSVRIDEDFGEIVITVFMQGQSELNVSVQVDTRVDTASGKNTIRLGFQVFHNLVLLHALSLLCLKKLNLLYIMYT